MVEFVVDIPLGIDKGGVVSTVRAQFLVIYL